MKTTQRKRKNPDCTEGSLKKRCRRKGSGRTPSCLILHLPPEMLTHVLGFLTPVGQKMCTLVCRSFAEALPPGAGGLNGCELCAATARDGDLALLKRLRERGCEWDVRTPIAAAQANRAAVLEWTIEARCPWNAARVCQEAATNGCLEVLTLLRAAGLCPAHHLMHAAAAANRKEVLRWYLECEPEKAREQLRGGSCYWTLCASAAENGHVDMIEWLYSQGCPWNPCTVDRAALGGQLEALKWLRRQGVPWSHHVIKGALQGGHIPVVEWVISSGLQTWSDLADSDGRCVIENAARGGHEAFLVWILSNGFPKKWVTGSVSELAARAGHLSVLKTLRNHGFPLHRTCPSAAAAGGHLEALKWLMGIDDFSVHGSDVVLQAAHFDHDDVLRWAISKGYPCGAQTLKWLVIKRRLDLLKEIHAEKRFTREQCRAMRRHASRSGKMEIVSWLGAVASDDGTDAKPFHLATKKKPNRLASEIALALLEGGCAWSVDDALTWLPPEEVAALRNAVKSSVVAALRLTRDASDGAGCADLPAARS